MSHSDSFTIERARRHHGSIADVLVTRGTALYHMPRWQRWLMPWLHFKVWRKPTVPFPDA